VRYAPHLTINPGLLPRVEAITALPDLEEEDVRQALGYAAAIIRA